MDGSVIRAEDLGLPHIEPGSGDLRMADPELAGEATNDLLKYEEGDSDRIDSHPGMYSSEGAEEAASSVDGSLSTMKEQVRKLEKELIAEALRLENGDSQEAARRLGMTRRAA